MDNEERDIREADESGVIDFWSRMELVVRHAENHFESLSKFKVEWHLKPIRTNGLQDWLNVKANE